MVARLKSTGGAVTFIRNSMPENYQGDTKGELSTVPVYYPAKPQPRERAWQNQRGKKTLLSLTLVRLCEMT